MTIGTRRRPGRNLWRIWAVLGTIATLGLAAIAYWLIGASLPSDGEAPEFERIQAVQANLPFQVLIPGFLPREFDRAQVAINPAIKGRGGEPAIELAYRTRAGAALIIREWIPARAAQDVPAGAQPMQTRWGKGLLLAQGENGAPSVWTDIGPLRVAIDSPDRDVVSSEQLVQIADTLGPASNTQVFYYSPREAAVKELPPAVEIKTNAQGAQELTLVITPGGYSPIRFSVRKGVPVRLTFRQLGQVGCGNVLLFPADPLKPTVLTLGSERDQQVLEFTPQQVGDFQFNCAHDMFRGVMTVRE